ncbi:MAG: lanthionine synthetase C family protein [Dactylosporangium sp.]|nr:lanthionine synthetase C family protein [Dactylosporangium sp.]NNJ60383.1 lanthionine synthetase C family protein [Dactylosporangium sp.]
MILSEQRLPVSDATTAAADLCDELTAPAPVNDDGDHSPSSPRWRHQSLSKGAAGVAILHAVRTQTGHGHDRQVHDWLARAVSEDLSAGPGAGLWFGAPAVAFALGTCAPGGYRQTRATLDAAVTRLIQRRLEAAHERIAAAARPSLSEFDLVRGLTGLGAHILAHHPDGGQIRDVLAYLIRLTEPVPAPDEAGTGAPGWWTADPPSGHPQVRGGHADQGMAHGIAGPLALLALALRRGITVPGQTVAIDRICGWLDGWRQPGPAGPWWPERIALADLRAGRPTQAGPARPSWCYGTPGLARAQQLAGLTRGDHSRQAAAEHALHRCLADAVQLGRLRDANLCHGWAGVAVTAWYAAADATTPHLTGHLPELLRALVNHADDTGPERLVGLIEGRAGVALTLHTIARGVASPWPTCLLIN